MALLKRRKLSDASATNDDEERDDSAPDGLSSTDDGDDRQSRETSTDTTDEIVAARRTKSKKTLKRKRRAAEPSQFGATLETLLNTDVQSTLPLSLKPAVARKRNDEKLEVKAQRAHLVEKKEKEDKCRITDVIGEWGMTSERELRKVAQRGVVKLFNIIQQSQHAASVAAEHSKSLRGTGKATLPAPAVNAHKGQGKRKNKRTLGTSKDPSVSKDEFFDMIRSGGLVLKT